MNKTKIEYLVALISFTLLWQVASYGQPNYSRYFKLEQITGVDLYEYEDIEFNWTMTGPVQAEINEGINYLKEGDYSESIIHLDSALKLNPTLWMAFYYRAIAHHHLSNVVTAEKDLAKCNLLNKNVPQAYAKLGDIHLINRQFDKAEVDYQKSISLNPGYANGFYRLGLLYCHMNMQKKAINSFEQCLKINPKLPGPYVILGVMKLRLKKDDVRAREYFNKAIQTDSTHALGYFWRGLAQATADKNENKVSDFNKAVYLNPNNLLFILVRGLNSFESQDYPSAFGDFKKIVMSYKVNEDLYTFNKTSLDSRIDLQFAINYMTRNSYGLSDTTLELIQKACCNIFIGNEQQALQDLNKAQNHETSSSIFFLKAFLFDNLKTYDSANIFYTKSLELDPDIYDAYKKRAIIRYKKNNWKGSYADLREMIRLQPKSLPTYVLSGIIKLNFKDYLGAIIDLTKYIKLDSSNFEIWKSRAMCRELIKDYLGSIDDLRFATKLDSSRVDIYQSITNNYFNAGDTVAAIDVLKEIRTKWPENPLTNLKLSEAFFSLRQYDSASQYLNHALQGSASSYDDQFQSQALFIKGRLLLIKGDREGSLKLFNQSIKLDNNNPEKRYYRALLLLEAKMGDKATEDLLFLKNMNYKKVENLYIRYNIN